MADSRVAKLAEIEAGLAHFKGTDKYHRTHPAVLITDGVKYLCDQAECYWLIDIIWSVLDKIKQDDLCFLDIAIWHDDQIPAVVANKPELSLAVAKDNMAVVVFHNGDDGSEGTTYQEYYRQEIPYTDLVFEHLQLYIGVYYEPIGDKHRVNRVIMLPSEY